jgi:hypothetical protein
MYTHTKGIWVAGKRLLATYWSLGATFVGIAGHGLDTERIQSTSVRL